MSLPDDFWESRFQEGRTPWEREAVHPAFTAWLDTGELAPCRILVPGAGRSPEPEILLRRGFDVEALDLAPAATTYQRDRLGADRVAQADVTTWTPAQKFDAIYDQTCLCALPPSLWNAYEAQLRSWLRPGGRLFVLLMQTGREGGPPFDCPIPEMRRLFAAWTWPETIGEGVAHKMGTERPVILLRGPD